MSAATDELVDVIAEALFKSGEYRLTAKRQAEAVLAALVDVYGEPGIGERVVCPLDFFEHEEGVECINQPQRRLVFPWQAVTTDAG